MGLTRATALAQTHASARGHLPESLCCLLVHGDVDDDGEDLHGVQRADAVQPDVQEGVGVLVGGGTGEARPAAAEEANGHAGSDAGGTRGQLRTAPGPPAPRGQAEGSRSDGGQRP